MNLGRFLSSQYICSICSSVYPSFRPHRYRSSGTVSSISKPSSRTPVTGSLNDFLVIQTPKESGRFCCREAFSLLDALSNISTSPASNLLNLVGQSGRFGSKVIV